MKTMNYLFQASALILSIPAILSKAVPLDLEGTSGRPGANRLGIGIRHGQEVLARVDELVAFDVILLVV